MSKYDQWPRTPDITDDLTDGAVRRVWYLNDERNCSHVSVWMPDEAIEMFFSAKGCVDVTKYWNGSKPEDKDDNERDTIHVCDVPDFAAALLRGLEHAASMWKKI